MRIFINDFEINNAANRVYVNEDITGLDLPAIRTSKGQRAGSHGGYIGKQLFDVRDITFQGRIFSDTFSEAVGKRRAFQAKLPLYPKVVNLRIIDDDGMAYLIYCQVIDFKMPIGRFRGRSNFKLDLEAVDSTIYDDNAGAALNATIYRAVPGGLLFSPESPVFGWNFYFSGGQTNTSVVNSSDLVAYPLIVIPGRTTNPVLTNTLTGQVFSLVNYAVGDDAVTQIDMKNRTVRLGTTADLVNGVLPDGVGSNMFGYVGLDDWWGIAPGSNPLSLDSDGGSDVRQAQLFWRPGYWGI